jgi:2-haloacid dehalogenase
MSTKGTIAFDIIGTCFSLDKPRQKLIELGAPPYAMQLWFAQTLRDAFALSHAGHYQPLIDDQFNTFKRYTSSGYRLSN